MKSYKLDGGSKKLCLWVFLLFVSVYTAEFNHPGISNSQAELDLLKVLVNSSKNSAVKEGYEKMIQSKHSKLTYVAHPHAKTMVVGSGTCPDENDINNDASAAYALALRWVVTGEKKYAQKSIEILNAWSAVLEDIYEEDNNPKVQDELEAAWYGPVWFAAAEIIRHYDNGSSGWSDADIKQFDDFVAVFKIKATSWDGSGSCPNQGISVSLHRMALGVYTDDRDLYNSGLNHFLDNILKTNVANRKTILKSGEVWEINRGTGGDCGHANYNIEGIFDIAEMAWIQGDDIYSLKLEGETKPRLLKGLEYMAKAIIAGPVQTTEEGPISCTKINPLSNEIAYNHYIFRDKSGYELPYTKKLLLEKVRPSSGAGGKFIPWDTFTHGEISSHGSTKNMSKINNVPTNNIVSIMQTKQSLKFIFIGAENSKPLHLKIYNMKGSVVNSINFENNKAIWNFGVATGLYLYRLFDDKMNIISKRGVMFVNDIDRD